MVTSILSGEFARMFTMRNRSLGWLIGAGASAAAGIPTGYDMILDLKAALYAEASGLGRDQVDATDPLWGDRISAYFDGNHGLPPDGDPSEYSAAFELAFPHQADRRKYIELQVLKGAASYGHRVLAALVSAKLVPLMVTTNFDALLERASTVADEAVPVADRANLTVATISTSERAQRVVADQSWPLLIKLHGDYQDLSLKNTADELQTQDRLLRVALLSACRSLGLLVVGYSGRDESVMATLTEAITPGAFPGGVFWVQRPGTTLLPAVREFLSNAEVAGVETYIVCVDTFDELAGDIARQTVLPAALRNLVDEAAPSPAVVPVQLPTITGGEFPVLRCSALRVTAMPQEARRLKLEQPATATELRGIIREHGLRHAALASQGSSIAAFGRDDELVAALGHLGVQVDGTVALDPVRDSWAAGLMVDALVGALANGRPLRRRMVSRVHSLLVAPPDPGRSDQAAQRARSTLAQLRSAYGSDLTGNVPKLGYRYAESVAVRLEKRADRWWCSYEPFTWVDVPREVLAQGQGDPVGDWRRERWARRYNEAWFHIIDGWARLLADGSRAVVRCTNLNGDAGIPGEFEIIGVTAWSKPAGEAAAVMAAIR